MLQHPLFNEGSENCKISFFSFQQSYFRMSDTFVPDYNRIYIKLDPFKEG